MRRGAAGREEHRYNIVMCFGEKESKGVHGLCSLCEVEPRSSEGERVGMTT